MQAIYACDDVAFPSTERGRHLGIRPVSQLNTQPMVSPVNASRQPSRTAAHHSGPELLARLCSVVDFHLLSFASLSWRSPEGVKISLRLDGDFWGYSRHSPRLPATSAMGQKSPLAERRLAAAIGTFEKLATPLRHGSFAPQSGLVESRRLLSAANQTLNGAWMVRDCKLACCYGSTVGLRDRMSETLKIDLICGLSAEQLFMTSGDLRPDRSRRVILDSKHPTQDILELVLLQELL